MNVKNIARVSEQAGIPEDRLEAHEKGELQLTDDELYAAALPLSCHPLDLLREADREPLWQSGRVTRRAVWRVDEASDVTTDLGRHRMVGTPQTLTALYEVINSVDGEFDENAFVHFECVSGVTHLIRFGAINRVDIREDVDLPARPEFNPQFQLAITAGVNALGADHPMTAEVKRHRTSLLVAMQRPLEKGVMEVRLNNGKVLCCLLSTEWGHDPCAELFYDIIHSFGPGPNFLRIPMTADYDVDQQFVRVSEITSFTIPSEHLARHHSPPEADPQDLLNAWRKSC